MRYGYVWATGYPDGLKVLVNLDACMVMRPKKVPMVGGLIGAMLDVTEIYLGGLTTLPIGQGPDGNPIYQATFATTQVKESIDQLFALPQAFPFRRPEARHLSIVPPVVPLHPHTPDATGPSDGPDGVGGPSATDTA